jgi:flagellar hook-associated protein 3 FlgL
MVRNFSRNLNNNQVKMNSWQSKLATNKQNVRLSDDPVSAIKVLNARGKQSDLTQYSKNLSDAQAWITSTETALLEANELIKRVYELAVYSANDVLGLEERVAISDEVIQLRDQLLTLGNSTLGDKYIFGGYNVTFPPFFAETEVGEPGVITFNGFDMVNDAIDIDDVEFIDYKLQNGNEDFPVSLSGFDFMGTGEEDNIWYIFNEFANVLQDTSRQDNATMTSFISSTQKLQSRVLDSLAEIGGRSARVSLMKERYDQDMINYTQMLSDVQDLDQAAGIMNFSMAEAVYRAALDVGGRVLPPSLMDFLR